MRIVYLARGAVPSRTANAVHVMKMCHAFALNGHDVTLCVPNGAFHEPSVKDIFQFYGVSPEFSLRRLMSPPVRGQATIASLHAASIIQRLRPSLVYTRSLDLALRLSRLNCRPFVLEMHAPPQDALLGGFVRLIRNPGLRRLVVISAKLRDILIAIEPSFRGRILVAHDAADDPACNAELKASCNNVSGFHVGYVGHLYPGRGTDLIRQLASAVPEATFHIVGGMENDRARLVEAGIGNNVILHGYHPPSQLGEFFNRFDVCIAPYQRTVAVSGGGLDTSAFMSPLKIFEYMSWAKPILSSDLPVLREVLVNGYNAILLPPDEVGAWVTALRRLMGNPEECRHLGSSAREDFLARYSWRERARRVLAGVDLA